MSELNRTIYRVTEIDNEGRVIYYHNFLTMPIAVESMDKFAKNDTEGHSYILEKLSMLHYPPAGDPEAIAKYKELNY